MADQDLTTVQGRREARDRGELLCTLCVELGLEHDGDHLPAPGARKTLKIQTVCTATVQEEWTFDVPADFDMDVERALSFLTGQTPKGVVFIGCEDDVSDENDREVINVWEA